MIHKGKCIPALNGRDALCPRCGQPVIPSDNPEYTYQCLDCDEDFYAFECMVEKNKKEG